jgi:alpha-L-fucosidase
MSTPLIQTMKQPLLLALAALLLHAGTVRAEEAAAAPAKENRVPYLGESPAEHEARIRWHRDDRFGMFIHFGLYSQAAGEWNGQPTVGAGEWIAKDDKIPLSQYAKLVPQFDPEHFDADAIAKLAKEAGMKYITITTKHHDGFVMWPSALTDWGIQSTPFKRDILRELADACAREGLTLCFYYSIMDWYSPVYSPRLPINDTVKTAPDMDAYVRYMKGQLKELLTRYGHIGVLWFDGCWDPSWNRQRANDLYAYVRSLQPGILVTNRVGPMHKWEEWFNDPTLGGDYGTPEQTIPVNGFARHDLHWEVSMTMSDSWGYKKSDHNWKSTTTIVRNLVDCASKGGNYLINVGPTGTGDIPPEAVERLKAVGAWMKVNGQAIYGTVASPLQALPWGRCTMKTEGGTTLLYLHVFDWPEDGELIVPGLQNKVKSASLLDGGTPLQTENHPEGLAIRLPASAPSPISSTIVLRIEGAPQVSPTKVVLQKKSGIVDLPAGQAVIHGTGPRYESTGSTDEIGQWTDAKDWIEWEVDLKQPGKFEVGAVLSSPSGGSFDISAGTGVLHVKVPNTPPTPNTPHASSIYVPASLGMLDLPSVGRVKIAVRPVAGSWPGLNLRSLTLKPVGGK